MSNGFQQQPTLAAAIAWLGLRLWSTANDAKVPVSTNDVMRTLNDAFPWGKLRPQLAATFATGDVDDAIFEFKRFLAIKVVGNDCALTDGATRFSPSGAVDAVWHAAMLWPKDYVALCNRVCGKVIDHNPAGQGGPVEQRMERYTKTLHMYEKMFLQSPNKKFWSDDAFNIGDMELFVDTLCGAPLSVRASANDSVDLFKQRIRLVGRFGPEMDFRLIFAVKQLEPGRELADYNIQPKSTVRLVVRVCGC